VTPITAILALSSGDEVKDFALPMSAASIRITTWLASSAERKIRGLVSPAASRSALPPVESLFPDGKVFDLQARDEHGHI